MDEAVLKRINEFLKERVGIENPEKAIFFDNVEVSGLDTYTLMEEFGKEFKVDMASFDPSNYNMGDAHISSIFGIRLFGKKKKVFDVHHLATVVAEGIWRDMEEKG